MKSGEPFTVAAIWENWKCPGSEDWVRTFCVITCPANELVADIHDRMPVIIPPESYDRWLGTLDTGPEKRPAYRDQLRPSERTDGPRQDRELSDQWCAGAAARLGLNSGQLSTLAVQNES